VATTVLIDADSSDVVAESTTVGSSIRAMISLGGTERNSDPIGTT
jgi:hypothetical protein